LARPEPAVRAIGPAMPDLRDIKGHESAKRALEIAAAGGHNLLMNGPPGAGKSMLAARLPSILPPLSPRELLDVSMIHSVAGAFAGGELTENSGNSFGEQHAVMGARHFARPRMQAAADQSRHRSGMMRRAERTPVGRKRSIVALIEDIARPDTAGSNLVRDAAESMRLSARGFHCVLKLARTIPDLAGSPLVQHEDLAGGVR